MTPRSQASDFYETSKDFAESSIENARELYLKAMKNLPENSGPVLALASAGIALGISGYLIGRSRGKKRVLAKVSDASERVAEDASKLDLAPVFKFLKLWMLYRIAV